MLKILLIQFLNILLLFNISKSYPVIKPLPEEVLFINDTAIVNFYGELEVVICTNQIKAYSYDSYSSCASDYRYRNYEYFFNNKHLYELNYKDKLDIPIDEQYIIFKGTGYIYFYIKTHLLTFNYNMEIILPYQFNYRVYEIQNRQGDTLEVSINNPSVYVYFDYTGECNSYCDLPVNGRYNVYLVNYQYAEGSKVKLLYTNRKDIYNIDLEKGDTIKYIYPQTFNFEISNNLALQYYECEEGILLVSGNPYITFERGFYSRNIINSTHELFYISPLSSSIKLIINPSKEEGEISIKGIKPTIIINFNQTMELEVKKGIGPQYVRINIDKKLKEDITFKFGTTVNWFEGKMFNENGQLNEGKLINSVDITTNDAGKIYTAIYNNDGIFTAKKKLNTKELNEYQYEYFTLNAGEEKAFKYIQKETNYTLIKFENGFFGTDATIYIYKNEDDVVYDLNNKKYSGYIKEYSMWGEITIRENSIYLIIKTNVNYNDYISFRNKDIILKNENPLEFSNFNQYNFIVFSLHLEKENNIIEILTNINDVLSISLYKTYQRNSKIEYCYKKSCKFIINKESNIEYFIYIKNINKPITINNAKLYILQYQQLEYYNINDEFSPKYFLLPFEFKFQINSNFISNINSNKEFLINYHGPLNQDNYNININNDYSECINVLNEQYPQSKQYYFNLKIKGDISNLIITVKGSWDIDLFLPYEKIALQYGGPYLVDFNETKLVKNNYIGNIIYFKVKYNIENSKYLFSMPITGVDLIIGDLFNENGSLNNETKKPSKYMINEDLFEKSNNIITIKYYNTNKAELYYEIINGEIIKNNIYNNYKTYTLNFQDNNIIYYFGLYDQNIDTYAYINNEDKGVKIYYKNDNSDLSPVLPTENIDSNFFHLVSQYNLIKFICSNENITKCDKEFTIFNPDSENENLFYPNKGIFYLRQGKFKNINLIISDSEEIKDIYRIITKSYSNSPVSIKTNSNYSYELNNTNKYINIFEISKGKDFSFFALSNENNLLFSTVLKGSIYTNLILYNNTIKTTNANNILFQVNLYLNTSDFDIEIINSKKIKFYYNLYKISKTSKDKENQIRKLTLPILNPERNESYYPENSDKVKINYQNSIFNRLYYDYYFALSYEQDLENPKKLDDYKINIIYKFNKKIDLLNMDTPYTLINYNKKYLLEKDLYSYLTLTFINYEYKSLDVNIENGNMEIIKNINLDKKYMQLNISKSYFDENIDYLIEIKNTSHIYGNNICLSFYYTFTYYEIYNYDFEEYNYKNFKISQKKNKISWDTFENVKYYEIIIINWETSYIDYFNNDCNLLEWINTNSKDVTIINTTKTEYEFEKKTQKFIVNIVAIDNKYNMRFVYEAIKYDHKKSKALTIVLTCFGISIIIEIIIVVLCFYKRKKKPPSKKEYNISMSEDFKYIVDNK